MTEKNINTDISYQPKTQTYSFSRSSENKKNFQKRLNIFFTLILGILFFLFLFFIFFAVLNYFNVFSLNSISPVFKNLPKLDTLKTKQYEPVRNIKGTNQFEGVGTLEKYDQDSVFIRLENKIVTMGYDEDSRFYSSKHIIDVNSSTPSAQQLITLNFTSKILVKNSLGKKVSVIYTVEKNKKILKELILYK